MQAKLAVAEELQVVCTVKYYLMLLCCFFVCVLKKLIAKDCIVVENHRITEL